jgi:hypothetical protein
MLSIYTVQFLQLTIRKQEHFLLYLIYISVIVIIIRIHLKHIINIQNELVNVNWIMDG